MKRLFLVLYFIVLIEFGKCEYADGAGCIHSAQCKTGSECCERSGIFEDFEPKCQKGGCRKDQREILMSN
ncbi:unnamed protein product, partial [Mesorhabditis belari]|uniref:Uncharacterized protein n=1 Tax=Mesorhabditis belari TaxID=2138241 RepID=A0AAF3EEG2_9BILA